MSCFLHWLALIVVLTKAEDVEISDNTAALTRQHFIASDDPFAAPLNDSTPRQGLYSEGALVKSTQALFGADCNLAWNLEQTREVNFTSPNYGKGPYPPNFSCHLSFTGSEGCVPMMWCEGRVELRSSLGAPCANEYLQVGDGVGGEQRWCGGMTFPHPVRASGDARDLYVKVQTSPKHFNTTKSGFRCRVKCMDLPTPNGDTDDHEEEVKPLEKTDFKMKTVHQCVCGFQNRDDRIVGGVDAVENEFPWLAALVQKGTRAPVCGGSLINDRWILTASHCFFNTNYTSDDLDVLLHADLLDMLYLENADADAALGKKGSIRGSGWDRKEKSDKDEHTQRYEIERVVIHPLYTKKYDFDVALVQLKSKIDLTALNAPTPICLPRVGNYKKELTGYNVTVAGWGKSHEKAGASTRKLQKLEGMPILPLDKCKELLQPKYELTDRMLCAGFLEGGRDACTGDSGGPLVHEEAPSRYRQLGVVSFGSGCARRNSPGIYSKLTDLTQWIIYHTNQVNPLWCRDTL